MRGWGDGSRGTDPNLRFHRLHLKKYCFLPENYGILFLQKENSHYFLALKHPLVPYFSAQSTNSLAGPLATLYSGPSLPGQLPATQCSSHREPLAALRTSGSSQAFQVLLQEEALLCLANSTCVWTCTANITYRKPFLSLFFNTSRN